MRSLPQTNASPVSSMRVVMSLEEESRNHVAIPTAFLLNAIGLVITASDDAKTRQIKDFCLGKNYRTTVNGDTIMFNYVMRSWHISKCQ